MERHKKFLVHDETERESFRPDSCGLLTSPTPGARINDLVTIRLCKPFSARKTFVLESVDRHALDLKEKAEAGAETLESAGAH